MEEQLSRLGLLLGQEGLNKLRNSHVAIFGIGGVGGHAVEALARCGIGRIDIIDNDTVCESNLNRQIIALHSTIGRPKVDIMKTRILDINPSIEVRTYRTFFLPQNKDQFDFSEYDYVIDAIDTVTAKLCLIEEAKKANVPIICSMGTGNKLDPTKLEVTDISKTSVCPLARVMRLECKKRGLKDVKVVYSKEETIKPSFAEGQEVVPGSTAFVPSVAGLIIASQVVRDLTTPTP